MKKFNLFNLIWANIIFKPLSSFFNVLLLAVGASIIIALLHFNEQIKYHFTKDLQGIDLVVSAKGSPLQIILSSVFHLDIPTGNIPLSDVEKLKKNNLIKKIIPLALGDNYNGYRIVGTSDEYVKHYNAELKDGNLWNKNMQVVLGYDVAQRTKLGIGQTFVGSHGLINSLDKHEDSPYTVVGILKPTGTVMDRLILTDVGSVWEVHETHHHDEEHEEHHHDDDNDEHEEEHHGKDEKHEDEHERELTAALLSYDSSFAASVIPNMINKSDSMQAASPAFEMARLIKTIGIGENILSSFGFLLVGFAVLGLFITLYNAVNERQYDIALMRSLGATRKKIFIFTISEMLALDILGTILGILLSHL
ncbi:MAG: ABC transporter permease, partial [Rickettsiales bacterium]|nr:ABC transporter permease [Rickettsiales bacterium]